MYFNNAIERINKIEGRKLEDNLDEQKKLGYEYLRRMAVFVHEKELKPINPLCINIATILGDSEDDEYIKYCSDEIQTALKNKILPKMIINFYLQLAKFADDNEQASLYLQIYEPMIRLLEQGAEYGFREGGLMIDNVMFFPLGGWYSRFLDAPSKEI